MATRMDQRPKPWAVFHGWPNPGSSASTATKKPISSLSCKLGLSIIASATLAVVLLIIAIQSSPALQSMVCSDSDHPQSNSAYTKVDFEMDEHGHTHIRMQRESPSTPGDEPAVTNGSVSVESQWHEYKPPLVWNGGAAVKKKALMHVCVTGGAGYIGSHFVLRLLEEGHAVTIIDNLSRGNLGAIRVLQSLAQPDQLKFHQLDIGYRQPLVDLFKIANFDVVVHFAAVAYVAESYNEPLMYYRNVTVNTMNILDAMASSGVRRIVYSSTCATYGDQRRMPITESTPQRPVSPYGSSKLASERIIKEFIYANSSMASVILRYFNVIGSDPLGRIGEYPRAQIARTHGRISGACFDAAMGRRKSLSIMGTDHKTPDGTCVRDYIHVMDLVEAHLLAISNFRMGVNRVYNVGIGKGYSVREFVQACINATGVNVSVTEVARRPGDAAEVYANPAKVKAELKWEPKYLDLTHSLSTAWNWTKRHPKGY